MALEVNGFSLERLLEHVAGLVWEEADSAKGLELIVAIDADIPDQLIGDSLHIGQVLINFVNNAVKFTEHGEVIVHVRLADKTGNTMRLHFDVEDTGIAQHCQRRFALAVPAIPATGWFDGAIASKVPAWA